MITKSGRFVFNSFNNVYWPNKEQLFKIFKILFIFFLMSTNSSKGTLSTLIVLPLLVISPKILIFESEWSNTFEFNNMWRGTDNKLINFKISFG